MGRSPMQCYEDFMVDFRDTFQQELGTLIEEVLIGSGPCGELRYPVSANLGGGVDELSALFCFVFRPEAN